MQVILHLLRKLAMLHQWKRKPIPWNSAKVLGVKFHQSLLTQKQKLIPWNTAEVIRVKFHQSFLLQKQKLNPWNSAEVLGVKFHQSFLLQKQKLNQWNSWRIKWVSHRRRLADKRIWENLMFRLWLKNFFKRKRKINSK